MGYLNRMIPNYGIFARALKEFDLGRLVFHAKNNLKTDIFHARNDYDKEFVVPNTIYIEPTMECNRRCDGCYSLNTNKKSIMDEKIAQNVFDAASQLPIHYIAWIGGEPLLPSVQNIVLGVSEDNPKVTSVFCTNGDFLDEKVAERISGNYNLVPFLSVDGFRETHNKRRGKESYENVMRAMEYLKNRHALFGYISTITSQNFREVSSERFIDEMIDKGSFASAYVLFLSNNPHHLQPMPQQFSEAIGQLNRLSTNKPLYILSAEYGRLNGKELINGKRLLGMTVDVGGGVRTERGKRVRNRISKQDSLLEIIASEEFQSVFRNKANGNSNAPDDSGRKSIAEASYRILNHNLR